MKSAIKSIVLLLALALPSAVLFSQSAVSTEVLADAKTIQGIVFPAQTQILTEGGKLKAAQPVENVKIGTVDYMAGQPIWFYPNGAVSNGVLAEDQVVDGILRLAGKAINFFSDGKVKYAAYPNSMTLATNTFLMGIDFPAYSKLSFDGGKDKVTFAWLADTTKIEGITVWGGSSNFFEGGVWQRPQIASNTNFIVIDTNTIGGVTFFPGTIIGFEGTNVKIAYLGDNTRAGDVLWPAGTWIRFGKDMKPYPMSSYLQLAEDSVIQDLPLQSNSMAYWYVKEQTLAGGTLSRQAAVQGLSLPAGTELHFTPDKKLQSFLLYNPGMIRNVQYPAYTEFVLGETGLLSFPPETEPVVNAHVGQFFYKGNTALDYFPNGKVKSGILGMQALVRGINLRAGTPVNFTAAGDLIATDQLTLADDSWIQRVKYKGGETVNFYPSGRVQSGILARDLEISSIRFRNGFEVQLAEDGGIKSGTLAQEYTNTGIRFEPDHAISFFSPGKVAVGTLSEDTDIGGAKYQGDNEVEFNSASKLIRGTLLADTVFGGIKYMKAREVAFNDAGAVKSGTIATDTLVQNIALKTGTVIGFGKTGRLESAYLKTNTLIGGLVFMNNTEVRFFSNGIVTNGVLGEEKQIGPIVVPENGPVALYANGNVYACALASSATIGSFTYKGLFDPKTNITGTNTNVLNIPKISLYFSEKGSLMEGILDGTQNVGGFPLRSSIRFGKSGQPITITLAEDFTVSTLPQPLSFKANSTIDFYPNGAVSNGTLSASVTLDANSKLLKAHAEDYNLLLKSGGEVNFYPSGYLRSAALQGLSVNNPNAEAGVAMIDGKAMNLHKGSQISFFENGVIQDCTLDGDYTIQGVPCEKMDEVVFDESGKLVKRMSD